MTTRPKRWLAVALFIAPITSGTEEGAAVSFESNGPRVEGAVCGVSYDGKKARGYGIDAR